MEWGLLQRACEELPNLCMRRSRTICLSMRWQNQLASVRAISRRCFASRQVRRRTDSSYAIGLSAQRRCCVIPRRVSWMSRWRAASKPSSTLRECSGRCAEPAPQNIGKNLCATMRLALWKSALIIRRLLLPLIRPAGCHDPARSPRDS